MNPIDRSDYGAAAPAFDTKGRRRLIRPTLTLQAARDVYVQRMAELRTWRSLDRVKGRPNWRLNVLTGEYVKKPFVPAYPCVPGTLVKLLSDPEKMPGYAWGIPALKTCPGAVTGEHSICGGHDPDAAMSKTNGGCYAQKGRYASATVQNAQNVRLEWVRECMKSKEGEAAFLAAMVPALTWATRKERYFRIHDSGDFFSPVYVRMWAAVVRALPAVRFWAPTRTWHTMGGTRPLNLIILAQMQTLSRECSNITIRPSALLIEEDAPRVDGLAAGSGVKSDTFNCPASSQGNSCGDCRSCWDSPTLPIYYHLH